MGALGVMGMIHGQCYQAVVISRLEQETVSPRALNNNGLWAGAVISSGGLEIAARRMTTNTVQYGTIGGASSCLLAINDNDWAVGYSYDGNGVERAVLQRGDNLEDLSLSQPAGFGASSALGVSNYGHVTGWVLDEAGLMRAFLYFQGEFTLLGNFDASQIGHDVNDTGTVVGTSKTDDGKMRGFIHRPAGTLEYVPGLGGELTKAYALNSSFSVVGESATILGEKRAYLYNYHSRAITNLGVLDGHIASRALAINDRSQVVGESIDGAGRKRGFLYTGGKLYDLNHMISQDDPLTVCSAFAINDFGEILAEALYDGESVTVQLSPLEISRTSIDASAAGFTSPGVFSFKLTGPAGSNYVVQCSTDCATWRDISEPTSFGTSPAYFQDDATGDAVITLYRLRLVD